MGEDERYENYTLSTGIYRAMLLYVNKKNLEKEPKKQIPELLETLKQQLIKKGVDEKFLKDYIFDTENEIIKDWPVRSRYVEEILNTWKMSNFLIISDNKIVLTENIKEQIRQDIENAMNLKDPYGEIMRDALDELSIPYKKNITYSLKI